MEVFQGNMAYVCFLSYSNDNRTKYMDKFIKELTQAIVDKLGKPQNYVTTFFAPSEIKTGEEWAKELGDAFKDQQSDCLSLLKFLLQQPVLRQRGRRLSAAQRSVPAAAAECEFKGRRYFPDCLGVAVRRIAQRVAPLSKTDSRAFPTLMRKMA